MHSLDRSRSAYAPAWDGQHVTAPHTGPALAAPDLDAAVSALRARGLRVSSARRLVLECLYAAGEPLSAERISGGLEGRFPISDLASNYRTSRPSRNWGSCAVST